MMWVYMFFTLVLSQSAHASQLSVLDKPGLLSFVIEQCGRKCSRADAVIIAKNLRATAKKHKLPVNLLAAIVAAESNFYDKARSNDDHGIAQINARLALDLGVSIDDLYDKEKGLDAAARFLSYLRGRGATDYEWVCRYNVGAYGRLVGRRLAACLKYAQRVSHKLDQLALLGYSEFKLSSAVAAN